MLTVKLVGIILIIASSTFIGFLKSHSLAARCKKLMLILDDTNTLYEYIEQGGVTLDSAIRYSFSNCDFLSYENGKILCFDNDLKGDAAEIEDFFMCLGTSVKKTECDRINSFKQKMNTRLKEAENNVVQKSKIYQTLGICIGLTIAILLI